MLDTPDTSTSRLQGHSPPSDKRRPDAAGPVPGDAPAEAADGAMTAPARTAISLTVNGVRHHVDVEDRWTLVELLRDQLDLTGTKIGCDRSECGACTVLMNGLPVYACSQLAVWVDGADVQTVEGLARNGHLSPLQQAFIEHNAPQCGFCTPGQLMTATALLNAVPRPDAAQVKHALVGILCRCSNYNAIVEAVVAAGAQQRGAA
jgi:aerobic-type carbon monoxide dehydrogenase small subunit (CoxS/CutS family)